MNETYHKPHFGNPGTRPAAPGQLATRFALAQLPKHQSQYTVTIEKAHHTFPVRKEKLHDLFPGSGGR